ncbi:MAG: hypothetical protein ABEH81_16530 [Halopenitus sp.]
MSALKTKIPKSARGPVGIGSLCLGLLGFTVGYVLTVLGITFFYDLAPHQIPALDSVIIFLLGIGFLGLGYAGLKGFMHFSY